MYSKKADVYFRYGAVVLALVFLSVTLLKMAAYKQGAKDQNKQVRKEEQGNIPPDTNPNIRVVLMNNGFQSILHEEVKIQRGEEILSYKPDSEELAAGVVTIEPKDGETLSVLSVKRGYGVPSYDGKLELYKEEDKIVLVNELPLEQYLCGVVPSEMPASYEMEALKTQAVCARSFAYNQMQSIGYPAYRAHVDDSTAYQVYGNSKGNERTRQAVEETAGEKLWYQNQVATTYYYSTSCGKTTDVGAWGSSAEGKHGYLKSVEVMGQARAYEEDLPWYRWTATIDTETMSRLVAENVKDIGTVTDVQITKRGSGDVALTLEAVGTKGCVTVETENKIRSALGGTGYTIVRQDGTEVQSSKLLPSAFFTIEKENGIFRIAGGGYGHGIGMSQNGANEMAKEGKTYREILGLFYHGANVSVTGQ